MTKNINKPTTTPESGETNQNQIQQKTWSTVFETLSSEQQDESKEIQTFPNVIICRRYYDDKQNDMRALNSQFPEILKNVTYLHNPWEVIKHLKSDQKNIIFVGQYFDASMTGTQLASAIKEKWLDNQVALITSIDVPYSQRSDCDCFYQINKSLNQSDGANIIVQHLKRVIKTTDNR